MQDNNNNNNKKHTILLTVIGIATLLVAIVGATFAYFTVQISGNSSTNNVDVTTDTYGIEVTGLDNGTIELLNQSLPQSEQGQDYTESLYFTVRSTSKSQRSININFESLSNNFCQKVASQDATACDNENGTISVSDELYYKVYSCTTATDSSTCTNEVVSETAMPTTDTIIYYDNITAQGTNGYKVVVGLKNKNVTQDYNQGKSFSAKLTVTEKAA